MKVHAPDGHAFMAAIGAHCNYRSAENRLAFDGLDWNELARCQAQAVTPGNGLAWEVHAGRVPMEQLATLMQPFSALINEQPLDALDIPRMRYELQGYVTWYADMDRRGGEHFLVMLRHGDEVAAMCDASWYARFPERVYQQLTAVARPWRGKGLAKGIKSRHAPPDPRAPRASAHDDHPQRRGQRTHAVDQSAAGLRSPSRATAATRSAGDG